MTGKVVVQSAQISKEQAPHQSLVLG